MKFVFTTIVMLLSVSFGIAQENTCNRYENTCYFSYVRMGDGPLSTQWSPYFRLYRGDVVLERASAHQALGDTLQRLRDLLVVKACHFEALSCSIENNVELVGSTGPIQRIVLAYSNDPEKLLEQLRREGVCKR